MRVTNNMIADLTLVNLQRSLSSFMDIQEQMTTGKRVNRPSDDPLGLQRTLEFRSQLSRIEQFNTNISLGSSQLAGYETILTDMNNLAQQSMDIALAVSNESNDSPEARPAFLNEVTSAIERMLQLVNTERSGRRIFAGYRTDTAPVISSPDGIRYVGDTGAISVEIDDSVTIQLNVNAQEALLKRLAIQGESSDLQVGIDAATLLAALQGGAGIDVNTFTVTDDNLGVTVAIDLNVPVAPTTVNDVITQINSALTTGGITNLTASIGGSNNIVFESTSTGLVSSNTSVANLNGGAGIDLQGDIRVRSQSGAIDFQIDISGSSTLGDVISAINTQISSNGVSNVTAAINSAGTGIDITDTNGTPLDLVFENNTGSTGASSLGINGLVAPVLNGAPLIPASAFTIAEGAGTTAANLGLVGSFVGQMAGTDVNANLTLTTPLARLNNSNGLTLGSIKLTQGMDSRIIDLSAPSIVTVGDALNAINSSGLNVNASINATNVGIQVVSNSPADSFTIENADNTDSASALGIYGAADMVGSMILLKHELEKTGSDSISKDDLDKVMEVIRAGMGELLNLRGGIGSKQKRLDATAAQLGNAEFEAVRQMSEIEDADITELVTRLASHENNYRAGLIASAKIIQPSLLDFLR
jgi:flagellar hook-associated protein 3